MHTQVHSLLLTGAFCERWAPSLAPLGVALWVPLAVTVFRKWRQVARVCCAPDSPSGRRVAQAVNNNMVTCRVLWTDSSAVIGSVAVRQARGTFCSLHMFFQVKLGVVRRDVDVSLQNSSDTLAEREALLRAQLLNIQNLAVDVPPGFLAPSRTHAAPAPPAHATGAAADADNDDEDEDDEDEDDDDALDEDEDESGDDSADGSG